MEILKSIANSSELLVVNQLATKLGKDQTTVFKSVSNLISKKILFGFQEYPKGRKYLKFTDKGAFIALSNEVTEIEEILRNHSYVSIPRVILRLRDFVSDDVLNIHRSEIFGGVWDDKAFDKDGKCLLDSPALRPYLTMPFLNLIKLILFSVDSSDDKSIITDPGKLKDYINDAKNAFLEEVQNLSRIVESIYP